MTTIVNCNYSTSDRRKSVTHHKQRQLASGNERCVNIYLASTLKCCHSRSEATDVSVILSAWFYRPKRNYEHSKWHCNALAAPAFLSGGQRGGQTEGHRGGGQKTRAGASLSEVNPLLLQWGLPRTSLLMNIFDPHFLFPP